MTRPAFTPFISLGNMLQIGALIASAIIGYVLIDARSTTNARDIAVISKLQDEIETRIRTLEKDSARNDERFSNILALLAKIDDRLERIENGGR